MTKIRQFWMVVPLDVKEDASQGRSYAQQELAMEVEPARPARNNGLRANDQSAAAYGFTIFSQDLKRLNRAFTARSMADDYAKEQAEKNPKVLFGVFGCDGTFETVTPTVIKKAFNEDGELTPVKES